MHDGELTGQKQAAAFRLLPQSSKQLSRRIAKQRAYVYALRFKRDKTKNIVEKLKVERTLLDEATKLKRMVEGARGKGSSAVPCVEDLSQEEAKARSLAVRQELGLLDQALTRLEGLRAKGGAKTQRRIGIQRQMLQARKKLMQRRISLLARGKDMEKARVLHPSRVRLQRTRLALPRAYEVPKAGEVIVLMRLLATGLTRRPAETDKAFRLRLRAYTQRALVRYINAGSSDRAVVDAVRATMAEDSPVIEAEVAAGGLVTDPEGEAVDPFIEAVAGELAAVTEDLQPAVVNKVSADEIDAVLSQADEVESELEAQPDEIQDKLENTLFNASSLLPIDLSPSRVGGRITGFDPSGQDTPAAEESEVLAVESLSRQEPPPTFGPAVVQSTAAETLKSAIDDVSASLEDVHLPTLVALPSKAEGKGKKNDKMKILGGLLLAGFALYLLTASETD